MLLSKSDLGRIAANFLEVLARERINTLENIKSRLGTKLGLNNGMPDEIKFGVGNSRNGTKTWFIDYCRGRLGIPIEMRFNRKLSYSQSIVKCEQEIKGYSQFLMDPYGNIVQAKKMERLDVDWAWAELERLSRI
jgi:hypothetical protein